VLKVVDSVWVDLEEDRHPQVLSLLEEVSGVLGVASHPLKLPPRLGPASMDNFPRQRIFNCLHSKVLSFIYSWFL
jgi:hypothetical protein